MSPKNMQHRPLTDALSKRNPEHQVFVTQLKTNRKINFLHNISEIILKNKTDLHNMQETWNKKKKNKPVEDQNEKIISIMF